MDPLVPKEGLPGLQLGACILKVIFEFVTHCVRIPPHRNCGRGFYCSLFWDKVSLYSIGWHQTHYNPPASASWILGLQVCATTASFRVESYTFCTVKENTEFRTESFCQWQKSQRQLHHLQQPKKLHRPPCQSNGDSWPSGCHCEAKLELLSHGFSIVLSIDIQTDWLVGELI